MGHFHSHWTDQNASRFSPGDWTIRPRRDRIERGDEIVHIHSKPMAVLECLAAAGGDIVSRDELFDTAWPGVIVSDDALTQCIVELRRAFNDSAHDPEIIRTIPRVGFCLVPSVTFLTEAEMATEDRRGRSATGVTSPMNSAVRITLIIAVATVVALVLYLYMDRPREIVLVSPIPSIAVLPFADMSEGRDQAYFADGLSEELLNSLARVEGLKVTGRTSSFYFRERNEKLKVIAETLGVNYLLEGSVRKDGEQLRITAQLLDASSGFHLWSQTYDRKLDNLFDVQDEISRAITNALKVPLGVRTDAIRRTVARTSAEAHDAYLRGRYLVVQGRLSAVEDAAREFEKAIGLDPNYALAHAELAVAILLQLHRHHGELTTADALAEAAPHAERAMKLDPFLAEAHLASARVMRALGNHAASRAYYRQAIEINPNYSRAYTSLAINLQYDLGRYDEALEFHEIALHLDPLSFAAYNNWLGALMLRNQLSDAERHIEKYASVSSSRYQRMQSRLRSLKGQWANYPLARLEASRIDADTWSPGTTSRRHFAMLGLDEEALAGSGRLKRLDLLLRMLGRPEDAVIASEANLAVDPMYEYSRPRLGLALAAAGQFVRARPILEEMWQRSNRLVTPMGLFTTEMAVALIATRHEASEDAGVDELLQALRDHLNRCHEAGITVSTYRTSVDFLRGLVEFLSEERETGLALIDKAAEDGYFILPREAYLQALYDDPGFAPIMLDQEARQARERSRFLSVICTNNPYASVWQPVEGTCKNFAQEGANWTGWN